jgi:thymidylate kinase
MGQVRMLELVATLFRRLSADSVSYVHWKSNEHLPAALRGETDLDLLIDPNHRSVFLAIIDELGFVPMLPPKLRSIPDLDSYLGFDIYTGSLVHLDVHYRLVLGAQLIKNHHLPVEEWLLSSPATLEEVQVPRHERELLLLYLRAMLKTTNRQLARSILKGGSPLPDRIRVEAHWLAGLVDPAELSAAVETSMLGITVEEVTEFHARSLDGRFDWRYVSEQARTVRRRLERFERLPRHRALPKKAWLRFRSGRVMKRLGMEIPPRHLAGPAPMIAAVGADGSGKTRLTKDLENWLGSKLVVHHIYFGQPKTGFFFKLLNKPGSVARGRAEQGSAGVIGAVSRYTDAVKWLALARKRRGLARRGREAARRGEVVLAERFPLPEFFSMATPMDGPRLQPDQPFARAEMRQYRAIDLPDLTLVLKTSLQTLRDRKLDLTVEEHTPKVAAVETLQAGERRIVIDAGRPYQQVLLEAQTAIWKALRESR